MLYFLKPVFKKITGAGPAATQLPSTLLLLLALPVMVVMTSAQGRCDTTRPATIVARALNVRSAPDINADRVAVLSQGTRVTVHEYVDGWLKITFRQQTGYIRNRKEYVHVEGTEEELKSLKTRAEEISREIRSHQTDLEEISRTETTLMDRLNDLAGSLNRAENQIQSLRKRIKALETSIRTNQSTAGELEKIISENEAYAAERLVALYKLSLLGEMNFLGAADSVYDYLRTRKDIGFIYRHDQKALEQLRDNRIRLVEITETLLAEKKEQQELEKTLQRRIATMSSERVERNRLLLDIREKEALRRAAIQALKQDARALDETITSLYVKPAEEHRMTGEFSAHKGLLKLPVTGTIISKYGKYRDEKLNIVSFRNGINIRADRGDPIMAIFRGQVIYAAWFKGYGNMIIIDHGDSYYTVYAHAQELFKKKGDFVETREVIATVGESASLSDGPSLYFEVRYQGLAVNPANWLQTG